MTLVVYLMATSQTHAEGLVHSALSAAAAGSTYSLQHPMLRLYRSEADAQKAYDEMPSRPDFQLADQIMPDVREMYRHAKVHRVEIAIGRTN